MFLYRLNRVDRLTFLRMAKRMALSDDGLIDAEEEAMIATMATEMGLTLYLDDKLRRLQQRENDVVLEGEFALAELDGRFKDNVSKNICLVELIGLGYANRNFNAGQNQFIQHVATSFDISETRIKRLEEWVVEMLELTQEGEQLIQK